MASAMLSCGLLKGEILMEKWKYRASKRKPKYAYWDKLEESFIFYLDVLGSDEDSDKDK